MAHSWEKCQTEETTEGQTDWKQVQVEGKQQIYYL